MTVLSYVIFESLLNPSIFFSAVITKDNNSMLHTIHNRETTIAAYINIRNNRRFYVCSIDNAIF
jgi:hypothetical protein